MVWQLSKLQSRFGRSLALRYLTITSIAVLSIQAIWGLIEGVRIYQGQVGALEEKVAKQGEFLREVAPEAIFNLDFLYLETLMRQTSEDADIVYSIILDREGLPLTQYLNDEDPLLTSILDTLPGDVQPVKVVQQIVDKGLVERITLPVTSFEQPLGHVEIGYSKRRIYGEVSQAALSSLLTTLTVGCVLAAITYLLFEREVRYPLGKLASWAQRLEQGKLQERVVLPRHDEIGVLGRALNQMAAQLQKNLEGLAEARDEAIAASQAKSEFLSNMSHELRTPLNAILGFTQLLERDDSLGKKQKENIRVVNRSGTHLLSLINSILEMSKIEAGRAAIEVTAFDLQEMIQSVLQMFQERAKTKAISVTFDYLSELPPYIEADEGKLRQVLINLLGNAIKFTQHGGVCLYAEALAVSAQEHITLPSAATTGVLAQNDHKQYQLKLAVEDTGPGIPNKELASIFETFTQTESGKKSQQGTGLGLPISRKYVQLMGGDLTVQSVIDQGTVFSFAIPVRETTADRVKKSTIIQPRVLKLTPGQPHYRLLVAEDISENRRLLVSLLEAVGFEVKEAQDGMEAIRIWEDWSPHLIWMDMRMPVMDGYEASSQIREAEALMKTHQNHKPVTVILALTAFVFEEHRKQALMAGCDDYVRKPFQEHEVFAKLKQYLNVDYIYEGDAILGQSEIGVFLIGVYLTFAI
ncbi:MAG: ATP-binding protein [Cyanobacteria bacterium P01_F01_bin.86]